ncbi:MAG TPA: hypothetical protein VFX85_08475 [Solirubrobacterales bacterium]|nr:hypothetical protein [Solirubrobacterales bacterium]
MAAIAVPVIAGFYVGGPGFGLAVGALAVGALIFIAVRQAPRDEIGGEAPADGSRHLLVVLSRSVEEQRAVDAIAAEVEKGQGGPAEVLVLSPARLGFLDRWASDLEGAREEAQGRLVITVASLAKAGIAAEARVGDENLVQAVEDQLQSFPATEVVLVTGSPAEDPAGEVAAAELGARLRTELRRIVV